MNRWFVHHTPWAWWTLECALARGPVYIGMYYAAVVSKGWKHPRTGEGPTGGAR